MSFEAMTWAAKQRVGSSSAKALLIVMANMANEEGVCYPSQKYLSEVLEQDIKTVQKSLKYLRDNNFIVDTGDRRGSTGHIIVYKMMVSPENKPDVHYGAGRHYIYRLTDRNTGQFYLGVRTCVCDPHDDNYFGSGKWPTSCQINGVNLDKEIICEFQTREEADRAEKILISEALNNPLCMNSPKTGGVKHPQKNTPNSGGVELKHPQISRQTPPNFPSNTPKFGGRNSKESKGIVVDAARGTRLPADWQPSDRLIAYCREKRPDLDPHEVAERFRDFWISKPGKDGRKADWEATWRNWVRNEKPGKVKPSNSGKDWWAQ